MLYMEKQETLLHDMQSHFAALTDPRSPNACHHLLNVIVLAICAFLCGAAGWEELEAYGLGQAT